MPKQVSITKKFLESTPYNDSSTYLVDTKTTRKPAQATPPSFMNVIEDCTSYEFCPKMKLKKMGLGKKFDLRKYAGVAEQYFFITPAAPKSLAVSSQTINSISLK